MHSSETHPYYYFKALEALRNRRAMSDDERAALMARVALNAPDLRAAAAYANLDNADWQHFYPAPVAPEQVTTNQAIDTFLEQYGHRSEAEDALLERLIFNPTPDYQIDADGLDAAAPADEQDSLIDSFVAKHTHGEEAGSGGFSPRISDPAVAVTNDAVARAKAPAPGEPADTPEDTSLSESLARIFVKQGKYERAFEIISSLNLNNPKKSVYFADQLRFLQKLIEIDRARAKASGQQTNKSK